jgi:hypothetical protein
MIKKLIFLGFGLALLIGLPLTIFVLQNQTQSTTGAAPVTKFSFDGPTSVIVGAHFDEKIAVDPGGSNQVSFIKFTFTYDPSKIDQGSPAFDVDTSKYVKLVEPTITCTSTVCTATGTLSVGQNKDAIIKSKTDIITVHLIAKANTAAGSPTQLIFLAAPANQALSVGAADQAAENVFQAGIPLSLTISNQGGNPSPTPTGNPTPSENPTPTGNPTPSENPTPTDSNGNVGSGNTGGTLSVACSSFTADPKSGNAPLTVTFTTIGSSSNDSISNITLDYGDGTSDTVASGSGIGTGNVNNQISHSYGNGSFTASAVFTTTGGATSDPTTCKQTITVGTVTPTPGALPPTGPGQTFVLIGIAGAVLTVIGLAVLAGL